MDPSALRSTSHAGLAADDVGRSDDRPPLLLLHGLTFDRAMWRSTLAELESIDPGRRAVAIDLPGHGDSPDASSYLPEAIAEQVHDAADAAGLESPVVVGHSAAAGSAFSVLADTPDAPFASTSSVSFVLVSPSTLIALNECREPSTWICSQAPLSGSIR